MFFWILLLPGLKNQNDTWFFLDFHSKPQKTSFCFGFQVFLALKTKKHMAVFGFSLEIQKTLVFFFGCATPRRAKSKKHMVFSFFPKPKNIE